MFRDLALALSTPGPEQRPRDSLRHRSRRASKAARKAVEPTLAGAADSQHLIEFARPYSPDLLGVVGKLGGSAGYYDVNGHYLRAQPAAATCSPTTSGTGELEPIPLSQQFDAFAALGLRPVHCAAPAPPPRPNAGWPSPTDHPFLDDGALDGECDPADVPPGP